MLKIVDIHAGSNAGSEYLVLENQGLVSINLRGWALSTDAFLQADNARLVDEMFIFRDEVQIKPYTRVVLFTGSGENGWVPTVDGRQAYCVYWCRRDRVWGGATSVHVLHLQNSRRIAPVAAAAHAPRTAP